MVTPHLKTRTIVRCCWVMWAEVALFGWVVVGAVDLFAGRHYFHAAAFCGMGALLSMMVINSARLSFADICDHIKTTSVDRFIAEGK